MEQLLCAKSLNTRSCLAASPCFCVQGLQPRHSICTLNGLGWALLPQHAKAQGCWKGHTARGRSGSSQLDDMLFAEEGWIDEAGLKLESERIDTDENNRFHPFSPTHRDTDSNHRYLWSLLGSLYPTGVDTGLQTPHYAGTLGLQSCSATWQVTVVLSSCACSGIRLPVLNLRQPDPLLCYSSYWAAREHPNRESGSLWNSPQRGSLCKVSQWGKSRLGILKSRSSKYPVPGTLPFPLGQ